MLIRTALFFTKKNIMIRLMHNSKHKVMGKVLTKKDAILHLFLFFIFSDIFLTEIE